MPHGRQSKKNAPGAGTIRKKTVQCGGKEYTYWEARYTVGFDPGTGKQRQKSITGKTQKEVAQKLREITTELDRGIYCEPSRVLLGEWLDIWQQDYLGGVKPRTAESYKCQIRNHIRPELGAIKLEALTTPAIQRFYNSLTERGLSAKTVKIVHGVLHKALQQAVSIGYLRFNPADSCALPRNKRKELEVLDDEAITRFLSAVKGHPYEAVFVITLFTGLRKGEVLGLTWDCVDLEKGTLLVNKQLSYYKNASGSWVYGMDSTKNSTSRKLTLPSFVVDVLRYQKARQAEWRLQAGPAWQVWNGEDLVFTNPLGGHLMSQAVYRSFKKLAASIGTPSTRFHDLRHSYAVAAIKSGDDIKTVQGNLGHATASFTLDVYGHLTDQMKQASADRMEQFIKSVSDG